jgi:hypothetical protein
MRLVRFCQGACDARRQQSLRDPWRNFGDGIRHDAQLPPDCRVETAGKQHVARRLRSNTYRNKIEGFMRTARRMVDKYRSAASRWFALVLSETDVQAYSATGDGIVFGE